MIFTLEALPAKHGDCLLLHFGAADAPELIVIDGGPAGVYRHALRPRLDALADKIARDGQLQLAALMISHIDDDHIRGLLDLTRSLQEEDAAGGLPFNVQTLWLNGFDDLVSDSSSEVPAELAEAQAVVAEARGSASGWQGEAAAVVASVRQGRELQDLARGLGWDRNLGFAGLVIAPPKGGATASFGPLTFRVVCPREPQLEALREEWRKQLPRILRKESTADVAQAQQDIDRSVYNLSSIVCLAELGGKRMLLTGDCVGWNILDGLEAAGELDADGTIRVDLLKLPHHGSDRNVTPEFFRRIKADHYVVSGDGKYENPEPGTFRLISESRRGEDDFTIHFTYSDFSHDVGGRLRDLFADELDQAGRKYDVRFRSDAEKSTRVDLLDEIAY
jgi:hypothetical protein